MTTKQETLNQLAEMGYTYDDLSFGITVIFNGLLKFNGRLEEGQNWIKEQQK